MRPNIRVGAPSPTIYVDARPLSDKNLNGIGRYTARICFALAARGAQVRFFASNQELLRPDGHDWSPDQDLSHWSNRVWKQSRIVPLSGVSDDAIGLWTYNRPCKRVFPIELSVLHDLIPAVIPLTSDPPTRAEFQLFLARSLPMSDAVLAISHSTKADAGWLTDFPQDHIVVAHAGPSQCLLRHLHEHHVTRRSNIGLLVSTDEPRQNASFVIDWFRSSRLLPDDAELWWVGQVGGLDPRRHQQSLQQGLRGRRIRLLGVVSDRQLCEVYQTVGWSVYPSLYEGFGFPILDSLRHGVPVLSSCNSSLREFAQPGVYFFDPCNADTLDEAWTECQAARTHLVSKAQLDQHYDWKHVASAILDLARDAQSVERTRTQLTRYLSTQAR